MSPKEAYNDAHDNHIAELVEAGMSEAAAEAQADRDWQKIEEEATQNYAAEADAIYQRFKDDGYYFDQQGNVKRMEGL